MFQEIADAIRSKKGTTEPINAQNFATEIESIEVGENPEIWTGTTLISREDVLVENVYANTQLTVAEVTKMLSQLTYYDDPLTQAPTYWIFVGVTNRPYCFVAKILYEDTYVYKVIGDAGNGDVTLFTSSSVTNDGFVGFNPSVAYPVPFNAYGYSGADDYKVGSQNNLINGLVSIEDNFKKINPNIVTIKAGKTGTQLVSSPDVLVETIYLNTDLSVEEVKNILSGLTYMQAEQQVYVMFSNAEFSNPIMIGFNGTEYAIVAISGDSEVVFFASSDFMGMGITWTGWNPDITYPVAINSYGFTGSSDMPVGQENTKLTSLVSMNKDFETLSVTLTGEYDGSPITTNESVNLQDYIDNGKLPMRINVEDKLQSFFKRSITEIKSEFYIPFSTAKLPAIDKYTIYHQNSLKKLIVTNEIYNIDEYGISENHYLDTIDVTYSTDDTTIITSQFSNTAFNRNYSLKHILFRNVNANFFTNNTDSRFTSAIEGCCYFTGSGVQGDIEIESGQKIGKIYVPDELVETAKTAWTSWADMIYPISAYIE